jgi:catechol 2,3-dioxygenase-like lactoylglutathione lyase family enzyme
LRSWNLNATDLEETVRFYKDVLGAEETGRQTIAGAGVARLRLGEQGIGLFDAATGDRPGVPHHTFSGDGPATADELVKSLEDRGVKVDGIRVHGEGPGYSVYVNDPSGNRLELSVDPR